MQPSRPGPASRTRGRRRAALVTCGAPREVPLSSFPPGARLPDDLPARLRALRDTLLTGLLERDVAIRLALLAALSGEHLLLLGPPGTAKSLVARRLRLAFGTAPFFERLLTRFTVPEELFGPLSIRGLEQDRYERLTASYLPTAKIAFLDEIFKANSAILNALLTLLNEREFDNGAERVRTPLAAVIGASNELPQGEELRALYDRFLLRLHVGPVSTDAFPGLLALRGEDAPEVPDAARLTPELLAEVQAAARHVEVPDDVVALLVDLRAWCAAESVTVSDRRWRKVVRLLQTSALTNGRTQVSVWDGWLLQHCVGDTDADRDRVYAWYAARVGVSAALDASKLTKIVVRWEAQVATDRESRSQAQDEQGRLLYAGPDGKPTTDRVGEVQATRGKPAQKLYLLPASGTRGLYGHVDRTNGGKGVTRDELDDQWVHDPRRGGSVAFREWSGRAGYLAERTNWLTVRADLPPLMGPTRHKPAHVAACLGEIATLRGDVDRYLVGVAQRRASLEREIRDHVWVTPDFVGPASQHLARVQAEVEALRGRLDAVRQGFEALPVEGGTAASTPSKPRLRSIAPTEPVPLVLRDLLVANGAKREKLAPHELWNLIEWHVADGEAVERGRMLAVLTPNGHRAQSVTVYAPAEGTVRVDPENEVGSFGLDDVLGHIEPLGPVA